MDFPVAFWQLNLVLLRPTFHVEHVFETSFYVSTHGLWVVLVSESTPEVLGTPLLHQHGEYSAKNSEIW